MAIAISDIDLYEALKSSLRDQGAKTLVNFMESKVENGFQQRTDVLATKHDVAEVRQEISEAKAEIIKWMFVFLIGQSAVIIVILKLIR